MMGRNVHSRARRHFEIRRLARAVVVATLVLASASCGRSTTAPQLGDSVDVRFGASVEIPGDTVSVRFTDVTTDSRCPTGVQCVWAGEAVAQFWVEGSEMVSLRLGPAGTGTTNIGASAIVRGYKVALVALKPLPTAGGPVTRSDYVATLRIDSAKD